ncbi:MAG: hypothetical protein BWK73_25455 [Thiothrix lacustris]|uniref:Uncharacterized protein n=1 Tax=Thiothrix lacustris TaxID=525917 RepID=A0A1Y1QLN1_9GAMM|nr:MAG: hypothetical protein BWK73_25455 [Thiothrix lacustris]
MDNVIHINAAIPAYAAAAFIAFAAIGAALRLSLRLFWYLLAAAIVIPLLAWLLGEGFEVSGFVVIWKLFKHGLLWLMPSVASSPWAALMALIGFVSGMWMVSRRIAK